jgi:hypothetical protein
VFSKFEDHFSSVGDQIYQQRQDIINVYENAKKTVFPVLSSTDAGNYCSISQEPAAFTQI